jgi:hypothetical protein
MPVSLLAAQELTHEVKRRRFFPADSVDEFPREDDAVAGE